MVVVERLGIVLARVLIPALTAIGARVGVGQRGGAVVAAGCRKLSEARAKDRGDVPGCRVVRRQHCAHQGAEAPNPLERAAAMRMVGTTLVVLLASLGVSHGQAADTFTGSGVLIGSRGEILTNSHVVEGCERIIVRLPSKDFQTAALVARDQKNDLAVARINNPSLSVAAFRAGGAVRAGDPVVALGYPLSGLLANSANLTVGNVSALAGLGDDWRYLQISAPVQPGNSGGPLLDASGHLVAIVTSNLNAASVARVTGDIPQNVNFAIKAEVARTFLDSKGIVYRDTD
jgi:S1-C subfamily serine protease